MGWCRASWTMLWCMRGSCSISHGEPSVRHDTAALKPPARHACCAAHLEGQALQPWQRCPGAEPLQQGQWGLLGGLLAG